MGTLQTIMKNCHQIDITDEQERALMDDLHAVIEMNQRLNLTRITSEESGIVLHLEDSLVGLPYINNAPDGLYGDMGTGGGFPGVPVGIMTGRNTVLMDSVKKKITALEQIVDDLGLGETIVCRAGRIEDIAADMKGRFSVVTARALSSLSSILELSVPLLAVGGHLVCYKAQPTEEELSAAHSLEGLLNMQLIEDAKCQLSDGSHRRILVYKKVGKPHISLPRRVGMAQNQPLTRL